jgi:hypothetical protein
LEREKCGKGEGTYRTTRKDVEWLKKETGQCDVNGK